MGKQKTMSKIFKSMNTIRINSNAKINMKKNKAKLKIYMYSELNIAMFVALYSICIYVKFCIKVFFIFF